MKSEEVKSKNPERFRIQDFLERRIATIFPSRRRTPCGESSYIRSLFALRQKKKATQMSGFGADYGARTRHLDLGKVALYQMS